MVLTLLLTVLFPFTLLYIYLTIQSNKPPISTFPLIHKRAILTGGSSGIGLSTAIQLIKEGTHLCIIARNVDKLKQAVDTLQKYNTHNTIITYISADISNYEQINNAIKQGVRLLHKDTSSTPSSSTTTP